MAAEVATPFGSPIRSPSCSFLGTGNDGGKTWVQVTAKSGAMCGGYTLWWGAKN